MEWFKKILRALGLLADIAAETAPIVTGKDAPEDLERAQAAGKASGRLGEVIDIFDPKKPQ